MPQQEGSNVPLPTYDWNAADKLREIRLFTKQLKTWLRLRKIKEEERVDYTLQILGKEGYTAMDRWVPDDEAAKQSVDAFLKYLEGTMDSEISQRIRVYELEDIKKKPDEMVDELINRIRHLARLAQIGDGSDKAIEFEVERRLIQAILYSPYPSNPVLGHRVEKGAAQGAKRNWSFQALGKV